jgi:periplasmic nitrate reductase NapD
VPDEFHISSLVVHSRPERVHTVADRLRGMAGVAVCGGTEAGKIIVTLETATEGEVVDRLNTIQLLDGVLAATLVFHHFEPAQDRS